MRIPFPPYGTLCKVNKPLLDSNDTFILEKGNILTFIEYDGSIGRGGSSCRESAAQGVKVLCNLGLIIVNEDDLEFLD